jgi:hypothetical protein
LVQSSRWWWDELPPPINDTAWLASDYEKGQTFYKYAGKYVQTDRPQQTGETISVVSSRKSRIYLLPILGVDEKSSISKGASWSSHAPSLSELSFWVSSFYNRTCEVLPPAFVYLLEQHSESTQNTPKSESETSLNFIFDYPTYNIQETLYGRISGIEEEHFNGISSEHRRAAQPLPRCQIRVRQLLEVIHRIKYETNLKNEAIAIVGVTMIDLFSHSTDLFVAGFAGKGRVSMLSLRRYHPRIVMSDSVWDDYAFHAKYHIKNQI